MGDDELLESYAVHEAQAEQPPYRSYREVLPLLGIRGVAVDLGLEMGDVGRRAVLRVRARLARLPRTKRRGAPTVCTSATCGSA